MNKSLKSWLGQVTTGHGMMLMASTVMTVLSGGMTWTAAAPLLGAAVVGLVWPENTVARAATTAAAADLLQATTAMMAGHHIPVVGTKPQT